MILACVAFDVTSGFHDMADLTAASIATRALRPAQAALIVAVFGFTGPLVVGTAVADTIGSFVQLGGEAPADALRMVAAGVGGAMAWNVVTWLGGIPSSSTHALVGGLTGAVVMGAGPGAVVWGGEALAQGELVGLCKIAAALLLSPVLGFLGGFLALRAARALLRGATPRANRQLRWVQVVSCAFLAFAHGANDAQKTMGIITLALVLSGSLAAFAVPIWVVALSASALTVGALTGGWRIVRTLGFGVYHLRPLHGATTQLASAGVIYGAALMGGPVSTTHVVSSTIMGTGAAERPRSVGWETGKAMLFTWLVTVPSAAVMGALIWLVWAGIAAAA
ncbi:MAG: inorganic phosphate transporter [Thermoleophilia bacterium]|nr:inorganic phosphate transporter [Thermoleophilia bacterium]